MITSSSFHALQVQRVRLYLSILRFWVLLSLFQGCSLFVYSYYFLSSLYSSLIWRSTVDGKSFACHVVMSSTTGADTVPLEPSVMIANGVHDAAETNDTDLVEFDLDELKEQLGIDSILDKLNDLAAKFCSEKSRTAYSSSEAQNSTQSPLQKPPKGFLTPRSQ